MRELSTELGMQLQGKLHKSTLTCYDMHRFGRYDLVAIFIRPCKEEIRALPHTWN